MLLRSSFKQKNDSNASADGTVSGIMTMAVKFRL